MQLRTLRRVAGIDSSEIYDPTAKTWILGAKMLQARSDYASIMLGTGKVLFTGGVVGWRLRWPLCAFARKRFGAGLDTALDTGRGDVVEWIRVARLGA